MCLLDSPPPPKQWYPSVQVVCKEEELWDVWCVLTALSTVWPLGGTLQLEVFLGT